MGLRRRRRTRPRRRMCSQGSVIALLANLPCSPAAYHHLERMPGSTGLAAELDSRASERCQAQEENPGGKWPFFAAHACQALCPHSAALARRRQCWRRLPFLSTRQHPLHLASQTNPRCRRGFHRPPSVTVWLVTSHMVASLWGVWFKVNRSVVIPLSRPGVSFVLQV